MLKGNYFLLIICFFSSASIALTTEYDYVKRDLSSFSFYSSFLERPDNYRDNPDPYEDINRHVMYFNFNIYDRFLLKPVSSMYDFVVPDFIQGGIINMINNIDEPQYIWKSLFQLRPDWAFIAAFRFLCNSTLGIFGFFDVARDIGGVDTKKKELENILGYLGVPNGPYFVLPFVEPRVARGLLVKTVELGLRFSYDSFNILYFPNNYLSLWQLFVKRVFRAMDSRIKAAEFENLVNLSLDPYFIVRDFFMDEIYFNVYGVKPKVARADVVDDIEELEFIDSYLGDLDSDNQDQDSDPDQEVKTEDIDLIESNRENSVY